MFDITFTAEQVQELEVLVRSRLEFIEEAREEYGYLNYADELVLLRVIRNKIAEASVVSG